MSNARIFSAKSIADYMKGQNIQVTVPTVIKYLGSLKEAYIIEDIHLYSPKAKAKLNYYFEPPAAYYYVFMVKILISQMGSPPSCCLSC